MRTRTRNAIAFAAAAAFAAGGLGLLARARRPPDLASHALDAVPAGALLVAVADLGALRASPVGVPFLREGREIPGLGKVRDVCGFDPMDSLTEVAVVVPAQGDAGEFGLVAAGPVDDEAVLGCASKVIDARGGRAVTTTLGSFRSVYDSSIATGGGEIAVRKGGPLLLGAGSYLRAMVDAADRRTPTIRSSVAHGMLAREVGDASVRVTVVLTPDMRRTLAEELESGGERGSPGTSIYAGALGITLGERVGVHAVLSCESASACASLAGRLSERRDAEADQLLVFGGLLRQIKIVPQGELVHARVDLPSEQATLLAERLLALRGAHRPPPEPDHGSIPRPEPPKPDEIVRPDGGSPHARTLDGGRAPDGGR